MRIPSIIGMLCKKILSFLGSSTAKKFLGVLLFFTVTIVILFSSFNTKQVNLKPDEVANRNIQSNITTVVIDQKQTDELKNQAAGKVQKVYQEDKYALANARDSVTAFFDSINELISANNASNDKKTQLTIFLSNSNKQTNIKIKADYSQLAVYLINISADEHQKMRNTSLDLIAQEMSNPLTDEALPSVAEQLAASMDSLSFYSGAREIMKIAVINSLRPDLIFNKDATDKAVKDAMNAVQPVKKTIKAGEIIVREGDRVTSEQISTLEQLGIQRNKGYAVTLLGSSLFVFITILLIVEFLRRYYPAIYRNDRLMLLVGLIFIIILVLTRFITYIKISDQPEINALVGYLAPAAAGSMLISILLDNRLAYFMTMMIAVYVGLITDGNQLYYAITAFIGGTVGAFQIYRLNQTSDLAKSGLYIGLANVVTILTLTLIKGSLNLDVAWVSVVIGIINGILSAVLMIGALPFLEAAFSITSMIKLLELSNPNNELLKRLLLEAPGTYHHSLMVGNLADASAEAIGANPLLVRVGAYYHDIGKLIRPEYFVENQRGFDNPHEKIAPALSALIIISHVKEGVELGRQARLPQLLVDFIEQHHGTSLAKYFYSRALEEDRDGSLSEDSFRYEGPKPQSKEVALVMLADTVEAGVRSLQDPTSDKIRKMAARLIKEKLNEGQLEESDLTFKDLEIIADSFCKVLEGVYHKRIEYPEIIVKEYEKRREVHGYHDNKPAEQD